MMPDRRGFLALAGGTAVAGASGLRGTELPGLGHWTDGAEGLPAYAYAGPLRFAGLVPEAARARVPDDPSFLLGNHKLTLFAHASGRLELMTGERGWARMNGAEGLNRAEISVDGARYPLTGMDAPVAAGVFHPGAALYDYAPAGLKVRRAIAVQPSRKAGGGRAAMLVTVEIRNSGPKLVACVYSESLTGDYRPAWASWSRNPFRVRYERGARRDAALGVSAIDTAVHALEPLAVAPRPQASPYDAEPPSLYAATGPGTALAAVDGETGVTAAFTLAPGERRTLRFVIGYSFDRALTAMRADADAMLHEASAQGDAYAHEWAAHLPLFAAERDPQRRREMRWNAAVLEAMASWREYEDETAVPQGTTYDYGWGLLGWIRDLAQHALPLCHTNPALARSVLRYCFKRTGPDGNIQLGEEGYGATPEGSWKTSDQQLFVMLLLTEYLRVTGDAAVLDDSVAWWPRGGASASGLDHLTQLFLYTRDRVGTGAHGLIHLWNSDWNDMFYFWKTPVPFAEMFSDSESHLNSAMAVTVLGELAAQLRRLRPGPAAELAGAMETWRAGLLKAFIHDLGDRAFPRRAYLGHADALGDSEMWLEPQGWTLQIPEIALPRKRALMDQLNARLLRGQVVGPAQIERSPPERDLMHGERENGGFWYALAGPVAIGLAAFDRPAAEDMLTRMTFTAFARAYPLYWTGRWSASDSLDSTAVPSAGLSVNPPWCAHAHAWPLYLYLRLRETA